MDMLLDDLDNPVENGTNFSHLYVHLYACMTLHAKMCVCVCVCACACVGRHRESVFVPEHSGR
jgi:hypothetical protein